MQDNGVGARILNGQGTLSLIAENGTRAAGPFPMTDGWVQQFQPLPFNNNPLQNPSDVAWTDFIYKPRYVRISAPLNVNLAIREIMVIESATFRNIAYQRNVTIGGTLYRGDPSTLTDGVINYDSLPESNSFGNLLIVNGTGATAASVTIDLSGVYGVESVIVYFDRYIPPTASCSISVFNNDMSLIGTFGGLGYQSNNINAFVTITNGIAAGIYPPTPSSSPSATKSSTASISISASPTGSQGSTPSNTGSVTPSPSVTPTATPSPLSPFPNRIRIDTNPTGVTAQTLNFFELWAISPDFRLVSAPAVGGVPNASSLGLWGGAPITAATINDLQMGAPYLSNGGITNSWAQITFPPSPVAMTLLINRVVSVCSY